MLWLALHFPRLPLDVLAEPGEQPLAVVTAGRGAEVLAANPKALALGVAPGMGAAAAAALVPGLAILPRRLATEAETLRGVAVWALQFSPGVSLVAPDTVLIEIGGCLRLFGGLARLLARVREGLAEMGLDAVLAVAPTPAGTHALARAGLEIEAVELASLERRLRRLPMDAIDCPAATLAGLAGMGIRTLDDCLRLPRDGLARRFGQGLLDTLDRTLGRLPDPRPNLALPEHFASRLELPIPVAEVEALLFGLRRQLAVLQGWLAARNAGVRHLTLSLDHERRAATLIRLALAAPTRDAAHLLALLRERLDRVDLAADVAALGLSADETAQLLPLNFSLFGDRGRSREDCLQLVERLQARLGAEAVSGLALYPEHRPELAWREVAAGSEAPPSSFPPRPVWLLPRPRPLGTHAGMPWLEGPLSLQAGPERIESGWWDGAGVCRDYFLARNASGARFWLFREEGRWFLHGLFA